MRKKEDVEGKKCMTCKWFYHVFDDYGVCALADGKNDTAMVRYDTKVCPFYKSRGVEGPWVTAESKS